MMIDPRTKQQVVDLSFSLALSCTCMFALTPPDWWSPFVSVGGLYLTYALLCAARAALREEGGQ